MTSRPRGGVGLYDGLMWPAERSTVGDWRLHLGSRARGRVLEIGAGTGAQLLWYPAEVHVTALEPDARMAARLRLRAPRAAASVRVVQSVAEHLSFGEASFDTAVATFALCTVADPTAVLGELRRVLAPGGGLLLLEHVHLRWQPARALQTLAAPAWAAVAGGCRLDRDTVRFVKDAGFIVLHSRSHVLGWIEEVIARRPLGLRY